VHNELEDKNKEKEVQLKRKRVDEKLDLFDMFEAEQMMEAEGNRADKGDELKRFVPVYALCCIILCCLLYFVVG
jgi:hypothetical protein